MPCDKSCRAEDAHHHHIQQKTGRGSPKTRGFARGAEDLLIPGRLGCPLIVYFDTAGYFRKVK